MNDIVLNTKKIKRFLPADEGHYNQDRPYSTDEIQQILARCDIRSRVIVLLMVSTGMRVGALPGLRLADVKKFDEFGLYLIWVYNNSKKDRYYTFCTPSCARAINEYLEFRKRCGEELSDKSPLLRNKVTVDNPFTAKASKPVSLRALELIIEGLLKQTGIAVGAGVGVGAGKQVMRTHGMRKFFINQLDKANVPYVVREYLAGHRLSGNNASYVRTSEEDRLNEYVKAVPLLTIDPSQRLQTKINELETGQAQEIATLKSKCATLEQEYQQFSHIQEELSKLKELLGYIGRGETEPVKNELQRRIMERARDVIGYDLSGVTSFEAQDKAELTELLVDREDDDDEN